MSAGPLALLLYLDDGTLPIFSQAYSPCLDSSKHLLRCRRIRLILTCLWEFIIYFDSDAWPTGH